MATQSTGPANPTAPSFEERVLALEAQDRLDEALELCEDALDRDWNNAIAHNLRGLILDRMGRMKEAIEAYREATFADPEFLEARDNLREAQADRRSPLVEQAPTLTRAAALCAALCVPVFVAASALQLALQRLLDNLSLSGAAMPALTVVDAVLFGLPFGVAFVIVSQFTRPGAAKITDFLSGLFAAAAYRIATGLSVTILSPLALFGEDQSPIAIARALSPVLGALVIGGALMAVFRVKRLGWLFPLVVGLSFALHESIEWLSVARAIFWYEYNFAVSGLPAPFVERLVTLGSIARALFFGAGVGATLQWHKLRAEDSDDEDDDDVSDDGMSFPIPSKADNGPESDAKA